jgi:hypothetical protein
MKELEYLKKEYLKIQTPQYLNQEGWHEISQKLESQKRLANSPLFARGLTFAAVAVLFLGMVFTTLQAAKPGSLLYPVKIFSDDITALISGNYEGNIEKRAQDVINVQNSREDFDQAAEEYLKALEKSKQNAQKPEEKQQFKNTLEDQEQKLKNAQKENQPQNEKLKELINKTIEAKGEIEGVKKKMQNSNNHENENGNNGENGNPVRIRD